MVKPLVQGNMSTIQRKNLEKKPQTNAPTPTPTTKKADNTAAKAGKPATAMPTQGALDPKTDFEVTRNRQKKKPDNNQQNNTPNQNAGAGTATLNNMPGLTNSLLGSTNNLLDPTNSLLGSTNGITDPATGIPAAPNGTADPFTNLINSLSNLINTLNGLLGGVNNTTAPTIGTGVPGLTNGIPGITDGLSGFLNGMPGLSNPFPGFSSGASGLLEGGLSGLLNGMPGLSGGGLLGFGSSGPGFISNTFPGFTNVGSGFSNSSSPIFSGGGGLPGFTNSVAGFPISTPGSTQISPEEIARAAQGDQAIIAALTKLTQDPGGAQVLRTALDKGTTFKQGNLAGGTVGLTVTSSNRPPVITLEKLNIDVVAHEVAHAANPNMDHEAVYEFGRQVARNLGERPIT